MDQIEPDHFDVVVVSSGLPEVLIGSALARAGKSVLLLESTESYGGSWASLSGPDYVHSLINRQLEFQLSAKQQQQLEQQQDAVSQEEGSSSSAVCRIALHAVQPLAEVSGVSLYSQPGVEQALENKHLLMDLAPKVLYQDEGMVELLVACQAHNYLEFKLIEGSYIYLSGKLRPVPASRAELFADKALPLAAKRALGRFLAACVEAQQGCGRLKDAFDARPLVDLLTGEGLDAQLQQVVLYGIAMADTPQQQQQQQQQTSTSKLEQAIGSTTTDSAAHAQPAAEASAHTAGRPGSSSSSSGSSLLTAAGGLAALQLYSSSLGRYGGAGAFMAPCYGSGSLPEAFVRLAAVKGAVTALRHGAVQLELLPTQKQQQDDLQQQVQQAHRVAEGSSREQASRVRDAATGGKQPSEDHTVLDATGAGPAAAAEAIAGADIKAALAAVAAAAKVRVVLASGQRLTADAVVACSAIAQGKIPAAGFISSSCTTPQPAGLAVASADAGPHLQQQQQRRVVCAVALLEGSVVDGESSLLLVFPPGSLGSQQSAVIRGLQLGPAFSVTPPGKYLLYLSAVLPSNNDDDGSSSSSGSGASAEQVLSPALQALAAGKGLQAFHFVDEEQLEAGQHGQQAADSSGEPVVGVAAAAATAASAGEDTSSKQREDAEPQQSVAASLLAQVLAVCYFTRRQPVQQFQSQPSPEIAQQQGSSCCSSSSCQDSAVLWCPAAHQGFMGYTEVVKAAEAAYRQQFPGLPWLTDAIQSAQPAAAAGGSSGEAAGGASAAGHKAGEGVGGVDGAAGGVLDDGELDAIDELTAALMELSALPKE